MGLNVRRLLQLEVMPMLQLSKATGLVPQVGCERGTEHVVPEGTAS